MMIKRPDTPLAATVFGNVGDPKQTPQQKRDSIVNAKKIEIANKRAKLDAILAAKRAEAAKRKATSDSISKVKLGALQDKFNKRAASLGLTPAQYSKRLEKQNKGGDQPTSTPDYSQKGARNPCPGGRCRR